MLKSLEIQSFRGFKELRLEPLKRANRLEMLAQAAIAPSSYSELVCVEDGKQKGLWCHQNQAEVLIDDQPSYLQAVREISPQTVLLHIL